MAKKSLIDDMKKKVSKQVQEQARRANAAKTASKTENKGSVARNKAQSGAKQTANKAKQTENKKNNTASVQNVAKKTVSKVKEHPKAKAQSKANQNAQRALDRSRFIKDITARTAVRQNNMARGRQLPQKKTGVLDEWGIKKYHEEGRTENNPKTPVGMVKTTLTENELDRIVKDEDLKQKNYGLGDQKVSVKDIVEALLLDPLSALKADSKSYANYGRGMGATFKEKTDEEKVKDATRHLREAVRKGGARQQDLSKHDKKLTETYRNEIKLAKQDFETATRKYDKAKANGNQEAMAQYDQDRQRAHQKAETWRRIAGGYSGGTAGDEYIAPELSAEDKKTLTKEGQAKLRAAQIGWQNAETDQERAMYAAQGAAVRKNPAYQKEKYDRGAYRNTDAEGRMMYGGTKEEREAEAKQGAAIPKAIGYGVAGSFASLPTSTARALQADAARNQDFLRALSEARGGGDVNISEPAEKTEEDQLPLGERLLQKADLYRQQATEGQKGLDRYLTEALITGGEMIPGLAATALSGGAAAPGLAVMGAQAAGRQMGSLNAQGEDPVKAFDRGIVSGAIEAGTELIPLRNLVKIAKGGGDNFAKNILTQAMEEVGTEEASELLQYGADKAFRDPNASLTAQDLKDTAVISLLTSLGMGTGAGMIGGRRASPMQRQKTTTALDQMTPSTEDLTKMAQDLQNRVAIWQQQGERLRERLANSTQDPTWHKHLLNELEQHQAEREQFRQELIGLEMQKAKRAELEQQKAEQAQEAETINQAVNQAMQEVTAPQNPVVAATQAQNTPQKAVESPVLNPAPEQVTEPVQQQEAVQGQETPRVTSSLYGQAENHIDNRESADLGRRTVKAFQWDHPEIKPFFQKAAQALKTDAEFSDATRMSVRGSQKDKFLGRKLGTVMERNAPLKRLHDMGLSTPDIIKACDAIINDQGQENYAAAKRVELALNDMLSNGYIPAEAYGNPDARVEPDAEYLRIKAEINGGIAPGSWEAYRRDHEFVLDIGDVTEDELRAEWEAQQAETTEPAAEQQPFEEIPVQRETDKYDTAKSWRFRRDDEDPTARNGTAMFADDIDSLGAAYGEYAYSVSHSKLTDFDSVFDNLVQEIERGYEYGFLPHDMMQALDDGVTAQEIAEAFNPEDIVMSADAWDNEDWVAWAYDRVFEPNDIAGIKTNNGAVVLDPSIISRESDSDLYQQKDDTEPTVDDIVSALIARATDIEARSAQARTPEERAQIEQEKVQWQREWDEAEERYSVGAAPGGFDPFSRMANEYGTIKPGENPSRIIDVPLSTDGKDRVRRYARTAMEAEVTKDEAVEALEKEVVKGTFSYNRRKDADALDAALNTIEDLGYDGALEQWNDVVEGRRLAGKDDIVLAQMLYSLAAQNGDIDMVRKLAAEIAAEGTVSGQKIQALRLLKKATPEGKLYYIRKTVDKLQSDLNESMGKKAPELDIDPELEEALLDAETEEEQEAALDDIYDHVSRQIPGTLWARLNAWRYFAMLGNPRTHIRNIVGNLVVQVPLQTSNKISALVQAATLPAEKRTRSVVASRAAKRFARENYREMRGVLSGNKYRSEESEIMRRRKLFPGFIQTPMNANSKALEAEDMFFKKGTYIRSLAEFITARKWNPETMTEDQLEEAMSHAIKDAKHATFQDESALASAIAKLENKNKATKIAIGGLVPFKGVPINIAKMGFELSPAGLTKAITYDAKQVRDGNMDATDMIDHLTRGLSGTSIALLGYFLASSGLLTAGAGDDEKENAFEMAQGSQEYAIDLGDYTYTIDWASPSAIPLFLGAEFYNARQKWGEESEDEGKKFKDGLEALTRLFDPMLNMTVLSGVSNTLNTISYSRTNPLFPLAWGMGQNYAGQFVPTLSGQIARTVDDTRRTVYADRNSAVPNSIQKFIQRQENKIPGLSKGNLPWMDAWGREDKTENPLLRAFENFLSPGYIAKKNTTEVDAELARLNEAGFDGVLPVKAKTSTKLNDQYLSAGGYEALVKTRGQTAMDMLSDAVTSDVYQSMTDADKAAYVKKIFDYAKTKGKQAAGEDPDEAASWVKNLDQAAEDYDVGVSSLLNASMQIEGTGDADGNGRIKTEEAWNAIQGLGMPDNVNRALFDMYNGTKQSYDEYAETAKKNQEKAEKEAAAAEKANEKLGSSASVDLETFQTAVESVGGYNSMSYTEFFDTMDSLNIPEAERPTYYDIVQSYKGHPWKKTYAQAKKYKKR